MKIRSTDILKKLLERYERSNLSKGGSSRNLHIRFRMQKDMPGYYDAENHNDAMMLESDIKDYESRGWLSVTRYDGRLDEISLIPEKIRDISEYLNIGLEADSRNELHRLLNAYKGQGIDDYIDDVLYRLDEYSGIKSLAFEDAGKQRNLLKALAGMMALDSDMLERVFSARYLGNSKSFEHIRSKVVHVLKEYWSDEEESDEVLAQFHILKNPGMLIIKGHGQLHINNSMIIIDDFAEGLVLTSADISRVSFDSIIDSKVMTIENLTSFYACAVPDTLIVYLGGYHNTVRREFLTRIYSQFPEKTYLHFGDIDAGGFYIYEHLKHKTGIPFNTYKMGIDELKQYSDNCMELTDNDRDRLKRLLSADPEYADVIRYMLEHNAKLEQEQIQV